MLVYSLYGWALLHNKLCYLCIRLDVVVVCRHTEAVAIIKDRKNKILMKGISLRGFSHWCFLSPPLSALHIRGVYKKYKWMQSLEFLREIKMTSSFIFTTEKMYVYNQMYTLLKKYISVCIYVYLIKAVSFVFLSDTTLIWF